MPRRRWGQHFLRDEATARRIVRSAGVQSSESVLEIGPGTGRLTRALLEVAARVLAVEVDPELAEALPRRIGESDRLTVISGDAVDLDLSALLRELTDRGENVRCVANLPYESATPILARLLEVSPPLAGISAVVQREVAERIAAGPGSRTYGYLSIRCQDIAEARVGLRLRPGAFRPPPRVDSAQIHLIPRAVPLRGDLDGAAFRRFAAGLFASRRKTLANNLRRLTAAPPEQVETALEAAGLEGGLRPEQLPVGAFADLFRACRDLGLRQPGNAADPV